MKSVLSIVFLSVAVSTSVLAADDKLNLDGIKPINLKNNPTVSRVLVTYIPGSGEKRQFAIAAQRAVDDMNLQMQNLQSSHRYVFIGEQAVHRLDDNEKQILGQAWKADLVVSFDADSTQCSLNQCSFDVSGVFNIDNGLEEQLYRVQPLKEKTLATGTWSEPWVSGVDHCLDLVSALGNYPLWPESGSCSPIGAEHQFIELDSDCGDQYNRINYTQICQ